MHSMVNRDRQRGKGLGYGSRLLLALLVVSLLAGCGPAERQAFAPAPPTRVPSLPTKPVPSPTDPGGQGTWTILVYLDADNNLEQAGLADFAEMQAAGTPPAGVTVLVQMDRIGAKLRARYTPLDGNWTGTRRYQITGSGEPLLLSDLGEVNMGDPAALAEFLTWGTASYPAQHTALVLWDHGGGWSGLDWDESSSGEDHLALSELAVALQTAGVHLDIAGFDACLMGQMDVFAALAPYASLAVASEEVIPAAGWDYRAWLGHLYAQPAIAPQDLARTMVADYLAYYSGPNSGPNSEPAVTLAAVDLACWGNVQAAVDGLVGALGADLAASLPAIGDSRAAVETYATAYSDEVEQYAAVDLAHFARLLAGQSSGPVVSEAAGRLDAAIKNAVVAEAHGSAFTQASGVAVYFPRGSQALNSAYLESSQVPAWADFLAAYVPAADTAFAAPQVGVESVETGSRRRPFLLHTFFEGEQIFQVYAVGGQVRDDGVDAPHRLRLLKMDPVERDRSRSRRQRDIQWLPQVAFVSDGSNGDAAVPWPTTPGSDVVSVLARYRPAADEAAYEAELLFNRQTGQLLRVWGSIPYGGEQRPFEITPTAGDQIQLYDFTLTESGAWTAQLGQTLTVPQQGSLALSWNPAPPGRYFLGLLAEDVAGHRALATVEVEVRD
jgi:hypothetical protein